MNWVTLLNLVGASVFALIGVIAMVAVCLGIWGHVVTVAMSWVMARVLYCDDAGGMSVQSFFRRKK
jgi:hypothetical protein